MQLIMCAGVRVCVCFDNWNFKAEHFYEHNIDSNYSTWFFHILYSLKLHTHSILRASTESEYTCCHFVLVIRIWVHNPNHHCQNSSFICIIIYFIIIFDRNWHQSVVSPPLKQLPLVVFNCNLLGICNKWFVRFLRYSRKISH